VVVRKEDSANDGKKTRSREKNQRLSTAILLNIMRMEKPDGLREK